MSAPASPRCQHVWSEDYVCESCGHVKMDSAPSWAATTRMASAPRSVWLALWSCAKRGTVDPPPVYPGNAWLTEHTGGMAESTLQGHLRSLQRMGWIARTQETRRSFTLAWTAPYPAGSRTLAPETHTPRKPTATPQESTADPRKPTVDPPETHTLNLYGPGLEPGMNLEGDAPAPATHESDPHDRDEITPDANDTVRNADRRPGVRGRDPGPAGGVLHEHDQPRSQAPQGQASTPGAPASSSGRVTDGAPVGETPERLPSLCTHPQCRNRMVPSPLGTAQPHDCRRCHDLAAAAANEHLGSKLAAHRARLQAEPPKASRVELTPAVHAAVVAARMSTQLAGPVWSEWMLEALDDIGVPEPEHAETVARVLASWHEQHPSSKPPKSNIWARRNRAWQRKAMGLGLAKPTGQGNMSGGLVPVVNSRPNGYETRAAYKARMALEAELVAT